MEPFRLSVETPVFKALREGVNGYQPEFDGELLGVECQDWQTSQRNIEKITKAGREIKAAYIGPDDNVVVVFSTGEQYLATGFGVGHAGEEVACLAKIASKAYGYEPEEWMRLLVTLPAGYWPTPTELSELIPLLGDRKSASLKVVRNEE